MDPDQRKAVELARSGKSFFLTGAGGTGKSYVIRNIIEALKRDSKDVALTAMTGCAALLLGSGAKTLHSWASIGLGKESVQSLLVKVRKSFRGKKNWLGSDVLIIDEVSMMTPDLLDKLDLIGQGMRKNKAPFGGLQVSVVLRTVHRQTDSVFLKILEEARIGHLTQESIDILNARRNNSWKKLEIKPTLLFTRRADVEEINMTQLMKCTGPDIIYKAKTVRSVNIFTNTMSTEQELQYAVERMDKNGSYVPELILRKGAQVMLLTNMDIEHGLVNGSRGVIEGFCDTPEKLPLVKFKNGETIVVSPTTWASEDIMGLDRQQIPLRLAYAITIHKAQGATLDCALIDIGDNTFEFGQAYVALSRVKSLDSLYIWDLEPSAFRVHPKVKVFLDTFQSPVQVSDPTVESSIQKENEDPTEPFISME